MASASGVPIGGQRFALLDGLRGVAAVIILLRHMVRPFAPQALDNGTLAVDFFCILSGFVLAHAYDARLASGAVTWRAFALARMIRLYPMLLLGTSLGAAVLFARIAMLHAWHLLLPWLAALALGVLVLPAPAVPLAGYDHFVYPLDPPVWTLSFMIMLNGVYAAAAPVLRTGRLAAVVAISGGALLAVIHARNGSWGGAEWATFGDGGCRVLFAFAAGVLLSRLRGRVRVTLGAAPAMLLALAVAAILLWPGQQSWLYHSVAIFLLLPAAVMLGAGVALGPRLQRLCLRLGAVSYPLYLLNAPLARLAGNLARSRGAHGAMLWGILAAGALCAIVCAAVCVVAFDTPVRSALTQWLRRPRDGVVLRGTPA